MRNIDDVIRDQARIFALVTLGDLLEALEAEGIETETLDDVVLRDALHRCEDRGWITVSDHVNAWRSNLCEVRAK